MGHNSMEYGEKCNKEESMKLFAFTQTDLITCSTTDIEKMNYTNIMLHLDRITSRITASSPVQLECSVDWNVGCFFKQ